jgi:hypothetical protein
MAAAASRATVKAELDQKILSCIPRRLAEWTTDRDDRIVVERPRPSTAGLRRAFDHLRWLMSHPRIRLDDLGSHVWRQMDGGDDLAQISASTSAAFPDRADGMDERVALFAMALHHQGLIELRVSTSR